MTLNTTVQKFIVHWGEMGTKWGINRTVAQIHALLYIIEQPLNAQQITETLQVARSNVSSSLHELLSWKLIKVVHNLGDRKDYYQSIKDVYEMAQIIASGRKQREIDPTIKVLNECVDEIKNKDNLNEIDKYSEEKLSEILNFINTMMGAYEKMNKLPLKKILKLIQLTTKLKK